MITVSLVGLVPMSGTMGWPTVPISKNLLAADTVGDAALICLSKLRAFADCHGGTQKV